MYMRYGRDKNIIVLNIITVVISTIIFAFVIMIIFTLFLYLLLLFSHLKFINIMIYLFDFISILFAIVINIFIIYSFLNNKGGKKNE